LAQKSTLSPFSSRFLGCFHNVIIYCKIITSLDYSRVEVAADGLAFGKKMAIKIINENEKRFKITILEKILHITENKLIIETSPFFYE